MENSASRTILIVRNIDAWGLAFYLSFVLIIMFGFATSKLIFLPLLAVYFCYRVVKLYFKEIIILETGIDISEKMVCNWNEIESVKTFIKSPIRVTRVMRGTEIICKITSLSPQYFEFIELLHKKTDPSVFDPVTTSVLSPAVRGSVIKYQKIFCLLYLASILILYIYEPVSRLMKHL